MSYDPLDFLRALEAELANHIRDFYSAGRIEPGETLCSDESRVAVESLLLDMEIPWQH